MASILLTPPAVEPLSLAEAKDFLRVDTADDDPLIAALIAAGRIHIEQQTGLALITQGWRLVFDCWPEHGRIAVRPAPLQALAAAHVFDFDGVARVVDLRSIVVDASESTLASPPASRSTSLPVSAISRSTCRNRCARPYACLSRTGMRIAARSRACGARRCPRMPLRSRRPTGC